MKSIYLVRYSNGEGYEDYEERVYHQCFTSEEKAYNKKKELEQDKDFLEAVNAFEPNNVDIWIEEIELID